MLMPKKTKYRKIQRGRMTGLAKGGRTLLHGEYGLMAVEPNWVTARQIEAVRVTISRKIKKCGSMFIRIFPDKSVTKKPAEVRMGKGKGNPEFWVSVVKRGRILFEVGGVSEEVAKDILRGAAYKLPLKTKFVKKTS
jgi:large subunit ribosomal protein L16